MTRIAIRYGVMLFGCILTFFLFMKFVGQLHNFNFRLFNGLFHTVFVYISIMEYKHWHEAEFNFLSGTSLGVLTSMAAVIPFAVFVGFYLAIDVKTMTHLQENIPHLGSYLTPVTAGVSILMEGLAFTIIASYIITRIIDRQTL